jgi:serine/threonine protein kinase
LQITILAFYVQILDDPSPSPSKEKFSPEFCSFVDACLLKDPDNRPTAEQVREMRQTLI